VSTDQCRVEIITQLTQVTPASLLPLSDVDNNGTAFRQRTTVLLIIVNRPERQAPAYSLRVKTHNWKGIN